MIVGGLRLRGATWRFRAHVLNRKNGSESVEVIGGRPGERTIRSFEPDRIYAAGGKGSRMGADGTVSRQLPVVDAPQLPFG